MSSTGEWSDAGRGLSRDGVDEERVSQGRAGGEAVLMSGGCKGCGGWGEGTTLLSGWDVCYFGRRGEGIG